LKQKIQTRGDITIKSRGRSDRDRMVVEFITTCAISAYTTNVVRCTRYNII